MTGGADFHSAVLYYCLEKLICNSVFLHSDLSVVLCSELHADSSAVLCFCLE